MFGSLITPFLAGPNIAPDVEIEEPPRPAPGWNRIAVGCGAVHEWFSQL